MLSQVGMISSYSDHSDDGSEDHKDVYGHGLCHGGSCGDTDDDWWQLHDGWCWQLLHTTASTEEKRARNA